MRVKRGILALEGDEGLYEGEVAVVDEVDSVELELVDASDISQTIDEINTNIEDSMDVVVAVESIIDHLSDSAGNGGLSRTNAAVVKTCVDHLLKRANVSKNPMPSLESFSGVTSVRVISTQLSMETLRETLAKIWEAIKKAIKSSIEFFKSLYVKYFDGAKKLADRVKSLKDKLETTDFNKQKERAFLNANLFRKLRIGNDIDNSTTASVELVDLAVLVFDTHSKQHLNAGQALLKAFKDNGSTKPILAFHTAGKFKSFKKSSAAKDAKYVHTAQSVTLPGNKVVLQHFIDTVGADYDYENPDIVAAFNAAGYELTDEPGSKDADVKNLPTLNKEGMDRLLDRIVLINQILLDYKPRADEIEALKKETISVIDDSFKKQEDKAESSGNGKAFSALVSVVKGFIGKIDKPASLLYPYYLNTNNAFLDYVDQSMKQYEKK